MFEKIYYLISIPLAILYAFGIIGAFISGFSDLARYITGNRVNSNASLITTLFFVLVILLLTYLGLRPRGSHGIMDY